MKPIYRIYVEGSLVEETLSKARANRLRNEYESEGWNVRVIKFTDTIIGELGIES